jgi:hypothetical protein
MAIPSELSDTEAAALVRIARAQEFMGKVGDQVRVARGDRDAAIAELRLRGWTQRDLSEVTGLSTGMLVKIDRAQGVVSIRGGARRA